MGDNYYITNDIMWSVREIRESSGDLLGMLDKKEIYLPFIRKIQTEGRKKEWLSVRVLLKEMLGEEKEIRYTDTGSPYLADGSFFISISHTKGFVAVALHKTSPVGIDIEYISPRIKKVRSRFINEDEDKHLVADNEEIHLLLHWSAKETLFKILNLEDVDFRSCLHIRPFHPQLNTLSSFSAYETKTGKSQDFSVFYRIYSGYIITFTSG